MESDIRTSHSSSSPSSIANSMAWEGRGGEGRGGEGRGGEGRGGEGRGGEGRGGEGRKLRHSYTYMYIGEWHVCNIYTVYYYLVHILQLRYNEFQSSFGIPHTGYGEEGREKRWGGRGERRREGKSKEVERERGRREREKKGGREREKGEGGRGERRGGEKEMTVIIIKYCKRTRTFTHITHPTDTPSLHIFHSAYKLAGPAKAEHFHHRYNSFLAKFEYIHKANVSLYRPFYIRR